MKLTSHQFSSLRGRRVINALTCYDFQMASWLNDSELDFLLVGDSIGEVVYGDANTHNITIEIMERHVQAVCRGAANKHVMADMPINTYNTSAEAIQHGKRLMAAGASSLKLENPSSEVARALIKNGIPVCGHIGLTPQTHTRYRQQGKNAAEAEAIMQNAMRLCADGVFLLLLEAVYPPLAKNITALSSAPTIGIASGEQRDNHVDGRILVLYDLVGLTKNPPPFVKTSQNFGKHLLEAVNDYCKPKR